MIVDCIGDLHGHYPKLEGGDLLIVAGDLTARDTYDEYQYFYQWLDAAPYRQKIVIAGNHDGDISPEEINCLRNCSYLCDSGIEFDKLKIFGSPWTKTFPGMNPYCKAFTCDTEEELASKFSKIPDDIDILITHGPAYGILDKTCRNEHVGSLSLRNHVMDRIKPRLHIFGHIHEKGGNLIDTVMTKFVNCSIVDENYDPVHDAIRVEM